MSEEEKLYVSPRLRSAEHLIGPKRYGESFVGFLPVFSDRSEASEVDGDEPITIAVEDAPTEGGKGSE